MIANSFFSPENKGSQFRKYIYKNPFLIKMTDLNRKNCESHDRKLCLYFLYT